MLARGEPKGAAAEHLSGDTCHKRLGMDMKVPKKFVGFPTTNHANVVAIEARA